MLIFAPAEVTEESGLSPASNSFKTERFGESLPDVY